MAWASAFIVAYVLVRISDQLHAIGRFSLSVTLSLLKWAKWAVIAMSVNPVATARAAYLQGTQILLYLAHWYSKIPINQPLPARIDRSITVTSVALSALCGYHLVTSRVSRMYMLNLKAAIQGLKALGQVYIVMRHAPIFPTNHFQSWAWWAMKFLLRFILGDFTWSSISWDKLFVMLAPTAVFRIYRYLQVIPPPPRTALQLALDPIERKLSQQQIWSQQQSAVLVELHHVLRKLDMRLAGLKRLK
ncbi:hypothetical protein B0H10DRAFT_1003992 [Mycena sp. CBHHK59/15]|nr:hypothetical protein B0H10DRAFT_1003992 [Mycena sp. CBHHK59/15]